MYYKAKLGEKKRMDIVLYQSSNGEELPLWKINIQNPQEYK